MLSKSQEKLIRSLHSKKGRLESGLCLVEGEKVIEMAGKAVEFSFTRKDTRNFDTLVTTETPQESAAVAKIPHWTLEDIEKSKTIVMLDGVQDPGNVGSILRLCLGFNASLLLIECADPSSPKGIRSSAGALFSVSWVQLKRSEVTHFAIHINRPIYRLEKKKDAIILDHASVKKFGEKILIIAGSEGSGIHLDISGTSLEIPHNPSLESLNVAHSLAILLYERYS
ncbi:MAG: RNA methyltransferase [bacterium]|nr:RNA methyltransferase [bacterium]